MQQLSIEDKGKRVLLCVYKLAGGSTNVPVAKVDLLNEVNRSGVMRMTADEFENYRLQVVDETRVLEASRLSE